ncbi:MAG: DNA-binding protein [Candidatus Bathyarchaeia archaeon]
MSEDAELDLWKRKRLLEMQKRLMAKKVEEEQKKNQEDKPKSDIKPEDVLKRIFIGRAMEVWDQAWKQYPEIMQKLEPDLARLVMGGEIDGPIDENQLLHILRTIGLDVRFDLRIKILRNGKLKTISEKLKEK